MNRRAFLKSVPAVAVLTVERSDPAQGAATGSDATAKLEPIKLLAPETDGVTHTELVSLSRQLLDSVASDGALPANMEAGSGRVGLSQYAVLAAKGYLALARGERYERLSLPPVQRYPEIAMAIDAWVRRNLGEHWAMPLEFSCDRLAEHARLQAWTLKPAWERPPQGPVLADQKYGARVRFG